MNRRRNLRRRCQKEKAAEQHETEPEADRAEGNDFGDLDGGKTPCVVEPKAQRAAYQSREADAVVECVADERGQGDLEVRKRMADVLERQRVVAGHHQVAEQREDDGKNQFVARESMDVAD